MLYAFSTIKIHEICPRDNSPDLYAIHIPCASNFLDQKRNPGYKANTKRRGYKDTRTSHVEHLKNGIG
ncbi:predicted protein [Sclerotinia sclerotiorum 1980 UF-70]|uniref:Uncharacterized protein n=1 Tax=Sclerotinia sclerotiorum (strain ATCC 18683 / 1980 / Ss-1) TaxID=665079 RepID=A7EZL7_SCLS1|nr:predicted protein [Sclerotinia sclerotiorum 1980 UF-70]EDN94909.1 predicted protein [Sclerotinia sclerotiorum 1980 UF-70]